MSTSIDIQISDISCPISHLIFYDPVIANSGIVFERDEINKWLKKSYKCPVTQTIITNLSPCYFIKTMIENYFIKNPNQKINQYKPRREHLDYVVLVEQIITTGKYDELLTYTNFHLNLFYNKGIIETILTNCSLEIIKYIIDNTINLECEDKIKCRPIHYALKLSTYKKIKYLINKNVNLECSDSNNCQPIHYACAYGSNRSIKYLLSKNINIKCLTLDNRSPASYLADNNKLSNEDKLNLMTLLIK